MIILIKEIPVPLLQRNHEMKYLWFEETSVYRCSLHYRLVVVLREMQTHNVRLDTGIIQSFSVLKRLKCPQRSFSKASSSPSLSRHL